MQFKAEPLNFCVAVSALRDVGEGHFLFLLIICDVMLAISLISA